MKASFFGKSVTGLGTSLNVLSSAALMVIMLLTCLDVSMRYFFSRPIPGTYEVVGLLGAVLVSFAMPYTMLEKGHVAVEILIKSLSVRMQLIIETSTHLIGIIFFLVLVWQSIELGLDMKAAGEITPTLHIPFYPVIYLIAFSFLGLCIAILYNLLQIWKEARR